MLPYPVLATKVADRMRGSRGLLFKPAVFAVLKDENIEPDRQHLSEIGKLLGRRRKTQRPRIRQVRQEVLKPMAFSRFIRDAERVCRLRRDHLLRDP